MPEPIVDDIDEAVEAALAGADVKNPQAETGAREAAALEEKLAAESIARANAPAEDLTALPMVSILAQGREALEEAMRQHQQKKDATPPYVPPARSAAQAERFNEELEAGRRAQERHQKQQEEQRRLVAAQREQERKERLARGETDESTVPVHRNGLAVPDPIRDQGRGGFTHGSGTFSPTA